MILDQIIEPLMRPRSYNANYWCALVVGISDVPDLLFFRRIEWLVYLLGDRDLGWVDRTAN